MKDNEIMLSIRKIDGKFTINLLVRTINGKEIENKTTKFGSPIQAIEAMDDLSTELKQLISKYV